MKYNNQEIIYIEYQDGKPFEVITGIFGEFSKTCFDFEIDCNDSEQFMHFESGSGGKIEKIEASKYADIKSKETCFFWIHPKCELIGEPKNITQILEPLLINGSKNPFDNSRYVYDTIYCKICDKCLDEDRCEHLTLNGNGDTMYVNGDEHE